MSPKIVFEDNFIMVLNKPAGWIVNEAKTTKDQRVVQTWIKENFQFPISSLQTLRNGIVHRLDKETSGILIIAKTEDVFRELQRQFRQREVKKTYIALAHGKIEIEEGEIKVPVGRLPWNRERFGVLPGGREAETHYRTISKFQFSNSNETFTLVELYPETGRTHQIRIHLKYVGHPIVSDDFYAGRKTARKDRLWCPRLFLHAKKLCFKHPETMEFMELETKIPKDLKKALERLEIV